MGVLEAFRVLRGMLHRAATMKLLVGLAGGLGLGGHAQAACNPVMIVDQPWSMTVLENCQAVFHVSVSGSAPYTFQWLKNGDAIADATNSSYATPPANLADNGTVYDVIVSNACGQLISSNAILTIS